MDANALLAVDDLPELVEERRGLSVVAGGGVSREGQSSEVEIVVVRCGVVRRADPWNRMDKEGEERSKVKMCTHSHSMARPPALTSASMANTMSGMW